MKAAGEQEPAGKHPPGSVEFGAAMGRIRKRRLFLWGVILIYLPAIWTVLQLTGSYNKTAVAFIAWVLILTVIATFGALARCPGCGNYFHMNGMTLLFLRRCLHCGLHVNADKS